MVLLLHTIYYLTVSLVESDHLLLLWGFQCAVFTRTTTEWELQGWGEKIMSEIWRGGGDNVILSAKQRTASLPPSPPRLSLSLFLYVCVWPTGKLLYFSTGTEKKQHSSKSQYQKKMREKTLSSSEKKKKTRSWGTRAQWEIIAGMLKECRHNIMSITDRYYITIIIYSEYIVELY